MNNSLSLWCFTGILLCFFAVSCTNSYTDSSSSSNNGSDSYSISYADIPSGYAGLDSSLCFGNYSYKTVTVSNKADFVKYAEKGDYLIYVNGMIDLSEGMIPDSYDDTTSSLDSFIKSNTDSKYTCYDEWKKAYASVLKADTSDKSSSSPASSLGKTMWALSNAYKDIVEVNLASNTMIIGLDSSSGFRGGSFIIKNVSNVSLKNLIIQDAYDPFPHHEKNDGFNAQYDCITVQGNCSHIWVDHCTLQDTIKDHVYVTISDGTAEKWQTYDGLFDLKGDLEYASITNCVFSGHDKTMLIGSSDDENVSVTRTITLSGNYFKDCVQRQPMVRNSNIHIYNNYYDFEPYSAVKKIYDKSWSYSMESETISSSYCIGVRYGSNVISENNYFSSNIKYAYSGADSSAKGGNIYISGDIDNSSKGTQKYFTKVNKAPFSIAYDYNLLDTELISSSIPQVAGSGKCSVAK